MPAAANCRPRISAREAFNKAQIVARVRIVSRVDDKNQPAGRVGFVYQIERMSLYKGYLPDKATLYEDGSSSCNNYLMDNDVRTVVITPSTQMQGLALPGQCAQMQIQYYIDNFAPPDIYDQTYVQ